jgi:hypothetical protein
MNFCHRGTHLSRFNRETRIIDTTLPPYLRQPRKNTDMAFFILVLLSCNFYRKVQYRYTVQECDANEVEYCTAAGNQKQKTTNPKHGNQS